MKKSRGMFGTLCLLVSIVVIYGLLGYRGYILYTEGIWLDWTVGNSVPDPMLVFIRNGRAVASLQGAHTEEELRVIIEDFLAGRAP